MNDLFGDDFLTTHINQSESAAEPQDTPAEPADTFQHLVGIPAKDHEKKEEFRTRNKSNLLSVTFPDGENICSKSSSATFVEVIRRIGAERVAALGKMWFREPLVSRTRSNNKIYAEQQKEVGDGWLVMTTSNTDQKYRLLKIISNELSLDLSVKQGQDLEIHEPEGYTPGKSKKAKSHLKVEFQDGTTFYSHNSDNTFVQAVLHMGVDKLKRANSLKLMKQPLITSGKVNNHQVQIAPGVWITVPPQPKTKMKMLLTLQAFSHKPLKVSLVEKGEE